MNKNELYKICLIHMDDIIFGYKYGDLFFLNPFFKIEEFFSVKEARHKRLSRKEILRFKKIHITKWFHPSYIYDHFYYRHKLKRDIDEYYSKLYHATRIMKEHIKTNQLKDDDAKLYMIDYLTKEFVYYDPHF